MNEELKKGDNHLVNKKLRPSLVLYHDMREGKPGLTFGPCHLICPDGGVRLGLAGRRPTKMHGPGVKAGR